MDALEKQVRKARRRLTLQRFVGALGWCWLGALTAVLAALVVNRFLPLGIPPLLWFPAGLLIGIVAAAIWTQLSRGKPLEAALEIDRRFGLKERVSSALAMPEDVRASEAGQAVTADAVRRVVRLEVTEKFPVRPTRQWLYSLGPAFLAILATWLLQPGEADSAAAAQAAAAAPAVQKAAQSAKRQLTQLRQQARKEKLPEADRLLADLEERTKELAAHPEDREKSLVKMNDLMQKLKERREQLGGGAEKLKEQLDALRNIDRGPADQFSKALGRGDLRQAADELKKLQEALDKGSLKKEQKEALAKQMRQMAEKLNKLAEAHRAAEKDLQKQIEKLKQSGQKDEVKKLEEQLQELRQQGPRMQGLCKMANRLGRSAESLRQGDAQQAADALNQTQSALDEMQKQQDETEVLDEAITQIARAKQQMTCTECKGEGCPACRGKRQGKEMQQGGPGQGIGWGRGEGTQPESNSKITTYDSRVRQKVGAGSATIEGMAEGPNKRPEAAAAMEEQVEAARLSPTDPLSGRQIPRKHREFAKEYLDQFREGK